MPLPADSSLWPRAAAVAATALLSAGVARAQYAGGIGDGAATRGLISIYINGTVTALPAYMASTAGGDGYSVSGRGNVALNGVTLPVAVFASSSTGGDGYSASGRISLYINGAGLPSAVYVSSPSGGDGYDARGLANYTLNGSGGLLDLYAGSPAGGDGYSVSGSFDVPLNINLAYGFIFSGGNGDGYDRRGVLYSSLNGAAAGSSPYISSTSGGDGYDARGVITLRLDSGSLPAELYVSSPAGGDGYDASGTSFISLSGAASTLVTYLGSNGDGYDSLGRRHQLLDPSLAPPAFVFAGGTGDGYDSRPVPYIYYMGLDGAPGPMTYSIWRGAHFSEEEVASGIAADNADPDNDGLPNIVEYATGADPRTGDAGIFGPQYRLSDLSDFGRTALPDKYLLAIVHRDPRVIDATLTVEYSGDAVTLWTADDAVTVNSAPSLFIVRDRIGLLESPRRLVRLRATVQP